MQLCQAIISHVCVPTVGAEGCGQLIRARCLRPCQAVSLDIIGRKLASESISDVTPKPLFMTFNIFNNISNNFMELLVKHHVLDFLQGCSIYPMLANALKTQQSCEKPYTFIYQFCKTVVSPLLMHWGYCSLILSHWYVSVSQGLFHFKNCLNLIQIWFKCTSKACNEVFN